MDCQRLCPRHLRQRGKAPLWNPWFEAAQAASKSFQERFVPLLLYLFGRVAFCQKSDIMFGMRAACVPRGCYGILKG